MLRSYFNSYDTNGDGRCGCSLCAVHDEACLRLCACVWVRKNGASVELGASMDILKVCSPVFASPPHGVSHCTPHSHRLSASEFGGQGEPYAESPGVSRAVRPVE